MQSYCVIKHVDGQLNTKSQVYKITCFQYYTDSNFKDSIVKHFNLLTVKNNWHWQVRGQRTSIYCWSIDRYFKLNIIIKCAETFINLKLQSIWPFRLWYLRIDLQEKNLIDFNKRSYHFKILSFRQQVVKLLEYLIILKRYNCHENVELILICTLKCQICSKHYFFIHYSLLWYK